MNGTIKDNVTSGNTGTLSLHKSGAGTLTITSENTYAGGTFVDAGTLVTNNASALGTGAVTVAGGATLQVASDSTLTLGGGLTLEDSSCLTLAGTGTDALVIGGALAVGAGSTLDLSALSLGEGEYILATVTGGLADGSDLGNFALSGDGLDNFKIQKLTLDDSNQLVLTLANVLEWNAAEDEVWAVGERFGITAFENGYDVLFGTLQETPETVAIRGEIEVGAMEVKAGLGNSYVFSRDTTTPGSITSLGSLTITSGTAEFEAEVLALTSAATATIADGATLVLNDADSKLNVTMQAAGSTLWMKGGKTDDGSTITGTGTLKIGADGQEVDWNSAGVTRLGSVTIAEGSTVTATGTGGAISTDNTGAVTLGSGSTLVLGSSNQGFVNINTGTAEANGAVRITQVSDFAASKWIYGSGTIEIAVGAGQAITSTALANVIPNSGNFSGARFKGTYKVTSGAFEINSTQAAKYTMGLESAPPRVVVGEEGKLLISTTAGDTKYVFNVELQDRTSWGADAMCFTSSHNSFGSASQHGTLLMGDMTTLKVDDGNEASAINVVMYNDVEVQSGKTAKIAVGGGDTLKLAGSITAEGVITKTGSGVLSLATEAQNANITLQEGTLALATGNVGALITAEGGIITNAYSAAATLKSIEVDNACTVTFTGTHGIILEGLTGTGYANIRTALTVGAGAEDFAGTLRVQDGNSLTLASEKAAGLAAVYLNGDTTTLQQASGLGSAEVASLSGNGTVVAGKYVVTSGSENAFGGILDDNVTLTIAKDATQDLTDARVKTGGSATIVGEGGSTIKNLTLAEGMTLSNSWSSGSVAPGVEQIVTLDGLTLGSGSAIQVALVGPDSAQEYTVPVLYEANANLALSGDNVSVALNLSPEEKVLSTGDSGMKTYVLIRNIGDGLAGRDLSSLFNLNYQNTKRTTYTVGTVVTDNQYDLVLTVDGNPWSLVWTGGEGEKGNVWRDDNSTEGGSELKNWISTQPAHDSSFFCAQDFVTFGTLDGVESETIYVSGTVETSAITVVGSTNYTWTQLQDADTACITTVKDNGQGLTVGTDAEEFTGTLRIETANTWNGDTVINSGTVVAANAGALSTDAAGAGVIVNAAGTLAVDLGEDVELGVTDIRVKGGTLAAAGSGGTLAGIALSGDTKLQGWEGAALDVEISSIAADTSITSSGTVNINSLPADATLSALSVTDGTTTLADGTSLSATNVAVGGTLSVAGGATLGAGSISGAGTLTVGSDAIGNLIYSGEILEMGAIVLNNATLTSTAEGGTTVSGAVTAGSQQDGKPQAAFEGTWKLLNLQEGANIQVGTGSGEGQQGHLTANKATGADITLFGEGSSLTVEEASAIQSVQAISGNKLTFADGTSVENLTGTESVLVSDGTLTVSELGLSGTDAGGVGTLVVTGDSSISGASRMGEIVVDGQAASLTLDGASRAGDLIIRQGRVTVGDAATTASSVTLSGAGATLDLTGGNLADTITMTAGSLANAGNYDGTVDVTGASGTLAMGGLTAAATLNLSAVGTALQLTELSGVTLGNGSSITLSNDMKDLAADAALLQLDTPASVTIASGAQVSVNINDVLSDLLATELNAETPSVSASFTIGNGNADLNTLDGAVTFDATLAVMNMTADFTESGQLVITRYSAHDEDAIYVATEDQGKGVVEWAGNGKESVYDSAEGFVAIVIDQDTAINLQGEQVPTEKQDIGLNLANLVGANGATLTVQGENTADSDVRDLVTINPNFSADDLPDNVGNSLSYNGNINLEGTDLQLKATDASTGEHTPDTVYTVNGQLTADENSTVILTSGTLQLNGSGNTLSGGLTVTEEGGVQTNGATTLSNTISGTAGSDTAESVDIAVGTGQKLTLAGASLEGVRIGGAEGSQMTIAAGATASTIDTASSVAGMLLHIEEGATLTVKAAAPSSSSMLQRSITTPTDGVLEYSGLTGKGTLASEVDANASLTLNVAAGDAYTFEGSMSGYNGTIILKGAGTQSFVSNAGGTTFAVQGGNLVLDSGVSSVKNLSLSGAEGMTGSATLNLADSDTLSNRTFTVNDTISLTAGSTLNLTLNLTDSMLDGTGVIQTTGALYDGGTVAITFAGIQGDLDLTGGEDIEAVIIEGDENETAGDGNVALADTDDKLLEKYFGDTAALKVVGGNLVLTGTTVDASTAHFHQDAAITKNGRTGAAMLDALYSTSNPQVNDPDSAAAAVLDELEAMILAGNTGAADRKMAAVAGASATAMGAAFAGDVQRQLTAIRNRTTSMGVSDTYVNPNMPYFNAWVNAEGNYRTMEQDGTLAGYELNSWGATLGFDADITPKFTAGLALTAMYGDLTAKAAEMAEGDLDTYYVTAFARYAPSAWVHTFVASIGIADASLDRTVSVGDGAYRTSGDTNGFGFGLMYEVGYTIPVNEEGSTALQPIANITYAHSSLGGYTETGSDMAVRYGDQTMDTLTIGLGLRAQTVVGENIYNRSSLLEGRVLAKFDLGDRSSSATAGLAGLGRVAGDVESAEIGAVGLELGAGLTIPVGSGGGSLFLDGSLEVRADYTNVNATVGYRVNF